MRNKKRRGGVWGPFLVVMDILAFAVSLYIAYLFIPVRSFGVYVYHHRSFLMLLSVITMLNFYFFDLYYTMKNFRRFKVLINLTLAIVMALLFSSLIILIDSNVYMGRRFVLTFFCSLFFLALLNRMFFSMFRRETIMKRAIMVGLDNTSVVLEKRIRQLKADGMSTGIEIAGYLSDGKRHSEDCGIKYLGDLAAAEEIIAKHNISLMIFSLNRLSSEKLNESIISLKLKGVDLISSVALYSAISGQIPYEDISGGWLIEECLRSNKFAEIKVKRFIDILLSSLALVLLLPLIMFLALLVKVDSRGPAFFVQKRVGRFGKVFNIIKLRSMAHMGYSAEGEAEGWHVRNAPRITALGHFLRKTHLDELPQLVNVIKGDMSLVGPRPEMEIFIHQCEETIPFYRLRLSVRPGLTGWAQVWYAHTSTLEGYKNKFKYDLFYLAHLSLKLDLKIMARTILRVIGYPREKKQK